MRSSIRVAGLLLTLSSVALGQAVEGQLPAHTGFAIVPNTIDYMSPLAKAVLSGDQDQVIKALETSDSVDVAVRAKQGERAGFTPLMLAAGLSNPRIADLLIKKGAKVTPLDDYHRSAIWYAALRDSPPTVFVLINAKDASDVVNTADSDLMRTPLHLAVRGSSPDVVSLLLKVGASSSKDKKDILDETPIEFCKNHNTGGCKALF
jgi:ankyrin repeat protein